MQDRILYVHPYNNYTGSTKVLIDLLKSQYSDLSCVTVIAGDFQEGFLSGLDINFIKIPIFKYRGRAVPFLSQIVWLVVGFFKVLYYSSNYDCIYINTILPVFAAIAARCRRKKVVYHIHEKWIVNNYKSRLEEFVLRHVKAHHIFVSKYLQEQYPDIYSPTDEIRYNKLSKEYVNEIELVPLDLHSRNKVIMLASLNRCKGIDKFIEVAAAMPEFSFTLIISSQMDIINEYFRDINISSNVQLLSRQSNVHPYLKEADFIINLSNPSVCVETFGLTIIEGMAYGLPAIAPNVGGPTEIIKNGINGYCIDVVDTNEIIETIKKCSKWEEYKKLYNNALVEVERFKY